MDLRGETKIPRFHPAYGAAAPSLVTAVTCGGRPGRPGRLGSGGGSAFGAGRFQHARPSLGVSGGSVSVSANLTGSL